MRDWFYSKFKGFFRDSVFHEVYRSVDDFMSQRFPRFWPRFLRAIVGWKTITGIVLIALTPALTSLAQLLTSLDFAEATGHVLYWGGMAFFILGAGHKILKFVAYEEAIDGDGLLDDPNMKRPEWPYNKDSTLGKPPKK